MGNTAASQFDRGRGPHAQSWQGRGFPLHSSPIGCQSIREPCGAPLDVSIPSPIARLRSAIKVAELSRVLAVTDSRVQCKTELNCLASVPEVSAYDAATVVVVPGILVILWTSWSHLWPRSIDYCGTAGPVDRMSCTSRKLVEAGQRVRDRSCAALRIGTASFG